MPDYFADYHEHIGSRADKHYKTTLFSGEHMMTGLNCLEPGQIQPVHDHATQDKVYLVLEGYGVFTIGEHKKEAGPGEVVFAPAGVPHGVDNRAGQRLVLLVTISPPPPPKS